MTEEMEERVRQLVREVLAETLPRLFASGGRVSGGRRYIVGERPTDCGSVFVPRKIG